MFKKILSRLKSYENQYEERQPALIDETFDNEILATSVVKDGKDVNMATLDNACQCLLSECEIQCLKYMFCLKARTAENMLKDYQKKKKEYKEEMANEI